MSELDRRGWRAFDKVTGGGVGATTGILTGLLISPELASVVGNASGPLFEEASYSIRAVVDRRKAKIDQAGEIACSEGNCTFEVILESALEDDRKIELIARALQAASVAEEKKKINALGRALARGVLNDSQIDEQYRIATTLAGVEVIDIRALALMSGDNKAWVKRSADAKNGGVAALTEIDPTLNNVVDSVVARLSTHGLITDESPGGLSFGHSWKVTDFGRSCHNALLEGEFNCDNE
ncbi:hypothetical protein [Actinopolyspora alba]|nr:hypothetical protein [Actinopolyspora alba]